MRNSSISMRFHRLVRKATNKISTARSLEDATLNGERNANRSPEWWGDFSQLVISRKPNFSVSHTTKSNWDFDWIWIPLYLAVQIQIVIFVSFWICRWLKSPHHSGFRFALLSPFRVTSSRHTVEGTEMCSEQICLKSSEQICLKTVLNVHNLSLAGYLNRIGYPWSGGGFTHRVTFAWSIFTLDQKCRRGWILQDREDLRSGWRRGVLRQMVRTTQSTRMIKMTRRFRLPNSRSSRRREPSWFSLQRLICTPTLSLFLSPSFLLSLWRTRSTVFCLFFPDISWSKSTF